MKREISNRNSETRRVVVVTGPSHAVGSRGCARSCNALAVPLLARNVDALKAGARESRHGSAIRVTQVHLPPVNPPQSERQCNKLPT